MISVARKSCLSFVLLISTALMYAPPKQISLQETQKDLFYISVLALQRKFKLQKAIEENQKLQEYCQLATKLLEEKDNDIERLAKASFQQGPMSEKTIQEMIAIAFARADEPKR
ncbi:MAG: hypothetical protein NTU89_02900 [Candidatus Dependentiae bacterium]|nr:hypothetical protein [Candidatus Dependentiae bacterium]